MAKEKRKNITLKVNTKIYDQYRKYCKKQGLIVSKQVENMMNEVLNKEKVIKSVSRKIRR